MGENHPVPPTLPLFPIPTKNCSNAHAMAPSSWKIPSQPSSLPLGRCSHIRHVPMGNRGALGCPGCHNLSWVLVGSRGDAGSHGKVGRDQAGMLLPCGALIIKQARQAQMAALI